MSLSIINNKEIKEKDLKRIDKHNKAFENIPFIINSAKDITGYLYCIENKLFDGYSESIYKVSSTVNIVNMLKEHDVNYFVDSVLIRKLLVPKKLFYEYMMILRLNKYRINTNKNFYVNLKEINKAFDEMEKILNSNIHLEKIHLYYLNFMNDFKPENYCNLKLEINKIANYLPEIKLVKKNSFKNNLNNDKTGYIYWIEHPYIKRYFNNNIQIIISSISEDVPWIKSCFLEDIKVIRVLKIDYFGIGKNMLNELLYLSNIKGCYYQISKDNVIKTLDLIEKYYKTYPDKLQLNFAFGQRLIK